MRRVFTFLCMVVMATAIRRKQKKPNFVWIFADDLGYNDIGFRNPAVHTPNMDKLASEGVILTNQYTMPQCSPSRHSFLTGRYPFKSSLQNAVILPLSPQCSDLSLKYLPEYLRELGYVSHAVGKWHLGYCRPECLPTNRGFDTFYGSYVGEGDYYTHTSFNLYDWHEADQVAFEANGTHSQDLVLDRTLQILDAHNRKKPLFLYLSPQNPHSPLQPKEEDVAHYEGLGLSETRKNYLGLVTGLDSMVGSIVQKLEEKKMMKNTYLMVVSDNGGDRNEGDNLPFRGAKGTLFEGGTKSNAFVYSPMLKKTAYKNDGLIHLVDWLPTLVSLAGGHMSKFANLDGVNQQNMLKRGCTSRRDYMVYNIDREIELDLPRSGEIAVRDERYKLMWGMGGQYDGYGEDVDFIYDRPEYQAFVESLGLSPGRKKRGGPYFFTSEQQQFFADYIEGVKVTDENLAEGSGYMRLFDLIEDPTESLNLASSHDEEHQDAIRRLTQFVRDEIASGYKGITPESRKWNYTANTNGYFETGWCVNSLPLPPKEPAGCC